MGERGKAAIRVLGVSHAILLLIRDDHYNPHVKNGTDERGQTFTKLSLCFLVLIRNLLILRSISLALGCAPQTVPAKPAIATNAPRADMATWSVTTVVNTESKSMLTKLG